jgi:hypothetical protein
MTFQEARDLHVKKLDQLLIKLSAIAADSSWLNIEWKEYVECKLEIESKLKDICRLNNAEDTAKRLETLNKE